MENRELFSLGELYPSDFLKPDELPRSEPVELKLVMDRNDIVRLAKSAPNDMLWGKYWYRSSVTSTMRNELQNIVDSILPLVKYKEADIWCDIACNDGTLLSNVPHDFVRIGVDPVGQPYADMAKCHAHVFINDYFSAEVYKRATQKKAKVVTSIAMFYDLEKPEDFIRDVYDILDDEGIWVMQLSYTPAMLLQRAFDNICHEHKVYWWLSNLRLLLHDYDFRIMDCQLNDINGGSFRLYIMKADGCLKRFGTRPYQDVCDIRIKSIVEYEKWMQIANPETWVKFGKAIEQLRYDVKDFAMRWKTRGKKVWAYGASTKGNTLLQYFGLDHNFIEGIAEKSREKWGLRTVGTNIPIHPEDKMREADPDYLFILPWHFIKEFKEREKKYLLEGGKFLVPCPIFEIIDKNDL